MHKRSPRKSLVKKFGIGAVLLLGLEGAAALYAVHSGGVATVTSALEPVIHSATAAIDDFLPEPQPVAVPVSRVPLDSVVLTDIKIDDPRASSFSGEFGLATASLTLENLGDRALDSVGVVVRFTDDAGAVVGERLAHPILADYDGLTLEAGATQTKTVTFLNVDLSWRAAGASIDVVSLTPRGRE